MVEKEKHKLDGKRLMRKKYDIFISYRKYNAKAYAQLIYKLLLENGYDKDRIFFDDHSIHAEHYDEKIRQSVPNSRCLLLFVTQDCFEINQELKNGNNDWYIEEIRTAVANDVTIIPIFFNGIKGLEDDSVIKSLKKRFTEEEVDKIRYNQGVRYDDEYVNEPLNKLLAFLPKPGHTIRKYLKGAALIIACFAVFAMICYSIGYVCGKHSNKLNPSDIFNDNTTYSNSEDCIAFYYCDYSIKYYVEKDSMGDLTTPLSNPEVRDNAIMKYFSAISLSSSITMITKYMKGVEYIGRSGGKIGKMVYVGALTGVLIGSVFGFCQGFDEGVRAQNAEMFNELGPYLKDKRNWQQKITKYKQMKEFFK